MKNLRLINLSVGALVASIEMEFENNKMSFIGKVIGFNQFFCVAETEDECLHSISIAFEIYLEMMLKKELENTGVCLFDDAEKE